MSPERPKPDLPGLTPEKWRRIEPLLQSAIERDPDERPKFLAEACGDNHELRRKLESVLAGEYPTREWLGAIGASATAPLTAQRVLGNYRAENTSGIVPFSRPVPGSKLFTREHRTGDIWMAEFTR